MKTIKYFTCIVLFSIQTLSAQNFWQQTNGPYGVPTVYDFLLYNDNTIFLGTSEGIIRSTDNGESWIRIEEPYLNSQIKCIAQDKLGVLYAGSLGIYPSGLKLLLKSTDEGNTWNILDDDHDAEIRYIFISYRDTILLGSWDMGVIRTFDGGVTWSRVNNGNIYNGIYEIIQLDDGSVLAGSAGGGVFKTTNWGDSWVPSNTGLPANSQGYRFAKSFCKTAPGCILVGTQVAIYYSTDYGDTWNFKSTGLTNKEINRIVKDENGTLYAGTDMGNGVYYSTNGGDYWNHLNLNITTYALGWDSDARLYAGGLSAGLYRFELEDSSWTRIIDQGYNPVEVNHLWITNGGNLIAGTHWWGLKYSSNNGSAWKTIYAPEGFYAIETINENIFIGGGTENIYVSNDTGKVWTATGNFKTLSMYYESISQAVYVGTIKSYPDSCNIYRSNDFGQSWELIYNFPHLAEVQFVKQIIVTKTHHIILADVGYSSQYGSTNKFYRSSDFGQSWEIIMQDEYFTQILEDDSLNVYALLGIDGNKLIISEDEGKTWITKAIPQTKCIASDNRGRLFRFYSNQIWYSIDKGSAWIEVDNSGLGYIGIDDAVIDLNNRIYLATNEGVYFGEADSIVVSVEENEPLTNFYLSQNYPNPFNPSTVISYRLPVSGMVMLKVYDVLGNEIATLVNEEKHPGTYEVEFSPESSIKHPASGIYFYQLRACDYTETKKMVLIK